MYKIKTQQRLGDLKMHRLKVTAPNGQRIVNYTSQPYSHAVLLQNTGTGRWLATWHQNREAAETMAVLQQSQNSWAGHALVVEVATA